MAVAFVQAKGGQTASGTTQVDALASSVTAGDLLIAWEAVGASSSLTSSSPGTPTDTLAQTFAGTDTGLANSGGSIACRLFYVANSGGGADTVTMHSAFTEEITGVAAEFSGVATTTPLDGTAHGTTTGAGTTGNSATITASVGDLIVVGVADDGGSTTAYTLTNTGTGAAFTIPTNANQANGANQRAAFAYAIDTTGGTYTAHWTINGGSSASYVIFIAAFTPAAGGGGGGGGLPFFLQQDLLIGQFQALVGGFQKRLRAARSRVASYAPTHEPRVVACA